jgi:predicted acyl esterase
MDRRTFTKLAGGVAATAGLGVGTASADSSFTKHDRVEIESWDGTTIVGTLFVPASEDPHPAVVATHGYGGTRSDAANVARRYAENGYVALGYASRGFGDSGGESGFDGPKEVADTLAIIARLAEGKVGDVEVDIRGPATDPAVGMDGGSYAGGIQLNTAAATREWFEDADAVDVETLTGLVPKSWLDESPLDAIVPRITWNSLLQSAAPNGVIKQVWNSFILAIGAEGYTRNGGPDAQGPDPRLTEFTAEAAATNEVPEEAKAYFAKRSHDRSNVADDGAATLIVQGWPDNLLPPNQGLENFHTIAEAGGDAAIAFFPGGHDVEFPFESGRSGRVGAYLDALSLAWMDDHVGDGPTFESSFPTVSIYQQQYDGGTHGTGGEYPAWRGESSWPPERASETTLDLRDASDTAATPLVNSVAPTSLRGPTGSLFGGPGADAPASSAAFDFRETGSVDVVGTPRLDLDVTPLGDDPALFATAALVGPDGTATVVDEQVMPIEIRDFPGRRTSVSFDMVAFQRYLDAGDRLRLVLSTTDNGYSSSRTAAGVVVHHDEPGTSTLTVDSIADGAELVGTPLVGRD